MSRIPYLYKFSSFTWIDRFLCQLTHPLLFIFWLKCPSLCMSSTALIIRSSPRLTTRVISELSFSFCCYQEVSPFIHFKINSTNLKTHWPFPHCVTFTRIRENTQLAGHINIGFKGNYFIASETFLCNSFSKVPPNYEKLYTWILSSNYSKTET